MRDAVASDNKQAMVPKLRFPEFRGAGAWAGLPLGKLLTVGNGRDYKHLSAGDVPVYGTGGYMLSVDDYLYEGDSVCIGRKGTIDRPFFLTGRFWTVDTLFYTHSFKNCLPQFIFLIFQQIKWKRHNEAGGVPSLSKRNIEKIKVKAPEPNEQQKIADCLSSLDALITAHTDKLAALQSHKQGLLQQLFPQNGETVPRQRFPEFHNAGEWALVEIGTLFGNRKEKGEAGLSIYAVTMTEGMVARSSVERRVEDIVNPEGNSKVHKGDITYNMMRMWQGASGVSPENCMVSPAYVVLAPDPGTCSVFFGYLLKLPDMLLKLEAHSQGLTKDRLRLYYKDFSTIEFWCPSRDEQKQIADCLSSLDDLIAAQAARIDALKQHQQGLLQQLLPAMDEAAT